MINIFRNLTKKFASKEKKSVLCAVIILLMLAGLIFFFDRGLAVGILLVYFLTAITFLILFKIGIRSKELYALFLIAILIHLSAVLFIYYIGFRLGGGADFTGYQQNAVDISQRFAQGNFSLDGMPLVNYFPVLIGIVYVFTLPEVIVGQLFTVWLAAFSVLLAYLITLEIGGSKKTALFVGLIASAYPSYLYFGSVLLKDTAVIPLVLAGMLFLIKMVKNFSWLKFLTFFIILIALTHLRFYVGYALMFSFIICWPLLSVFKFKKRITYWLLLVFFLGFLPQILGNGYYGLNSFIKFLNPKSVTYYREVVYNSQQTPSAQTPSAQTPSAQTPSAQDTSGWGSTFVVKTGFDAGHLQFFKNFAESFMYSLLGPFPWQFRYQRQLVGLAETIPWYLLIIISFYGFINFIRRKGISKFLKFYKFSLPLLLFGIIALGALSLFINNYGIIARIRIPAFICFLSVMFLSFNDNIEIYSQKLYAPLEVWRKIKNFWG